MQRAVVAIGNITGFLGHDNHNCVGLFTQANGRAVTGAERVVDIDAAGQRENAGGVHDAITVDHHAAIV